MVKTATDYPPEISEFDESGLTPVPCEKIDVMRVRESKVTFECQLNQIIEIGDGGSGSGFLVLGTIILFHLDKDIFQNGRIQLEKLQPIGRLAGNNYVRLTDPFEIIRKTDPE